MTKSEIETIYNEIKDYDSEQLYAIINKSINGADFISVNINKGNSRTFTKALGGAIIGVILTIISMYHGPSSTTPKLEDYFWAIMVLILGAAFGALVGLAIGFIDKSSNNVTFYPNDLVNLCIKELTNKRNEIKKIIIAHPKASVFTFEIINIVAPSVFQKNVEYEPLPVVATLLVLIRMNFIDKSNDK